MAPENGDWTKWSMYLIEGMKSMRENITELYQLLHDLDAHDAQERQRIVLEVVREMQALRHDLQNEVGRLNVELARIQVRITIWSTIFATIGTIIGSILIYSFRAWIMDGK